MFANLVSHRHFGHGAEYLLYGHHFNRSQVERPDFLFHLAAVTNHNYGNPLGIYILPSHSLNILASHSQDTLDVLVEIIVRKVVQDELAQLVGDA